MPGMTVAEERSITRAPGGISTAGPTLVMRSPLMRMTWLLSIAADLESNRRPARMATTWLGDARCFDRCGGYRVGGPSWEAAGNAVTAIAAAQRAARAGCLSIAS